MSILIDGKRDAGATTLLESGGTLLALASIPDGSALLRSGSDVVGSVGPWSIGTGSTPVLSLKSTTEATVGDPVQHSPGLLLGGAAWDVDDSVSRSLDWMIEARTVSDNTPYQSLLFLARTDGGAWGTAVELRGSTSGPAFTSLLAPIIKGGDIQLRSYDSATGLGTVDNVETAVDRELILLHTNRTDAADNVIFADVYNRNAAAITNKHSMRLRSFGWTNHLDAYAEVASIRADGSIYANAADFSNIVRASSLVADGSSYTGGATTCFTNGIYAAGANAPTMINVPGTKPAAQVGWIKIYIAGVAYAIPYWDGA